MLAQKQLPKFDFGSASKWNTLAYASKQHYSKIRSKWSGATVFCLGNGPSILETKLSLLDGCFVIGTNRAYQLLDKFSPKEFHLVVQDNYRLSELEKDLRVGDYPRHFGACHLDSAFAPPEWIKQQLNELYVFMPKMRLLYENRFLKTAADFSDGFSWQPFNGLYMGYSVIFSAIQLAAYMGARKIVCLGIDMDYSGPVSFAPGVTHIWPDFSYEKHCKTMFEVVRRELESRGIDIINSTPGGKVDALRRCPLEQVSK